jgi:DNA repair exonuclease SbcCD ATPase subunit
MDQPVKEGKEPFQNTKVVPLRPDELLKNLEVAINALQDKELLDTALKDEYSALVRRIVELCESFRLRPGSTPGIVIDLLSTIQELSAAPPAQLPSTPEVKTDPASQERLHTLAKHIERLEQELSRANNLAPLQLRIQELEKELRGKADELHKLKAEADKFRLEVSQKNTANEQLIGRLESQLSRAQSKIAQVERDARASLVIQGANVESANLKVATLEAELQKSKALELDRYTRLGIALRELESAKKEMAELTELTELHDRDKLQAQARVKDLEAQLAAALKRPAVDPEQLRILQARFDEMEKSYRAAEKVSKDYLVSRDQLAQRIAQIQRDKDKLQRERDEFAQVLNESPRVARAEIEILRANHAAELRSAEERMKELQAHLATEQASVAELRTQLDRASAAPEGLKQEAHDLLQGLEGYMEKLSQLLAPPTVVTVAAPVDTTSVASSAASDERVHPPLTELKRLREALRMRVQALQDACEVTVNLLEGLSDEDRQLEADLLLSPQLAHALKRRQEIEDEKKQAAARAEMLSIECSQERTKLGVLGDYIDARELIESTNVAELSASVREVSANVEVGTALKTAALPAAREISRVSPAILEIVEQEQLTVWGVAVLTLFDLSPASEKTLSSRRTGMHKLVMAAEAAGVLRAWGISKEFLQSSEAMHEHRKGEPPTELQKHFGEFMALVPLPNGTTMLVRKDEELPWENARRFLVTQEQIVAFHRAFNAKS